jgi:hypothetical protein
LLKSKEKKENEIKECDERYMEFDAKFGGEALCSAKRE